MGWVRQVTDDFSHAIGADSSTGFIGHIGEVIKNDPVAQAVVAGGLLILTGGTSAIGQIGAGIAAGAEAIGSSIAAAASAVGSGISAVGATTLAETGLTLGDVYSGIKLANALDKGDAVGAITSALGFASPGTDFAGIDLNTAKNALQTANAIDKGNTIGAISGGLNLAGSPTFGDISSKDIVSGLQTANAINKGDTLGAITGGLNLLPSVAGVKDIGGISTRDISTGLKTANAINNNNLAGIFSGVTNLAGVNDVGGLSTKDITTGLSLLAPATNKSTVVSQGKGPPGSVDDGVGYVTGKGLLPMPDFAIPESFSTNPNSRSQQGATNTIGNLPSGTMSLASFGLPETKAMILGEMGKPVTGYDQKLKQLAVAEDPLLALNNLPVYDTNVQKMASAPFYQNTAYSPFGFSDPTALFAAEGGSIQRFAEGKEVSYSPEDISAMLKPLANLDSGLDKLPKISALRMGQMGSASASKILPQLAAALKNRGITMAEGGRPDDQHHPHYDGTPVFRTGGLEGLGGKYVEGKGDGTSDDITAMLANGEYVFSADVVSALGNGSNKAGAQQLDHMTQAIRARARSAPPDKLPPDAKSPLEYLKSSKGKKHG